MKIKFRIQDGEVVGRQVFDDDYQFFTVETGEVECTDQALATVPLSHVKYVDGEVVARPAAEIPIVVTYNDKKCKQDLLESFGYDWCDTHAGLWGMISECLRCENWTALMLVAQQALEKEAVTPEQLEQFMTIVRANGAQV